MDPCRGECPVHSTKTIMLTACREFLETYPDAPLIQRPGQINAWDNEDFRAAVKTTNRSQVIVAGITTDVCE